FRLEAVVRRIRVEVVGVVEERANLGFVVAGARAAFGTAHVLWLIVFALGGVAFALGLLLAPARLRLGLLLGGRSLGGLLGGFLGLGLRLSTTAGLLLGFRLRFGGFRQLGRVDCIGN